MEKVKYLEEEISLLDEKYNNFQIDFVQVTNQTAQLKSCIDGAFDNIKELKEKDKQLKQQLYMKKYKKEQLFDNIEEAFHESKCDNS